jgi:prepilin-type N-terminal cleavage/methylation domain-containing protein
MKGINRGQRGMTLVEVMATVMLFGSLVGIGLVGLSSLNDSFRSAQTREQLRADILTARMKALSERTRIIMTTTLDGYEVGYDYPPYSLSGTIDPQSPIIISRDLGKDLSLQLEQDGYLTIDSRGNPIDDESSELTSASFQLTKRGNTIFQGTILPTGTIDEGGVE